MKFFVILLSLVASVFSQISTDDIALLRNIQKLSNSEKQQGTYKTTNAGPNNSIVPELYKVGAGDQFTLFFKEDPTVTFTGRVNANSDLYLKEFGYLSLKNLTLAESLDSISSYFTKRKRHQNPPYIYLSDIKEVTVHVTGMVKKPGTYNLSGNQHVLDAIIRANEEELPAYNGINYREVIVTYPDTTENYDLFSFLFHGTIESNPYLYSGSVIKVKPVTSTITVSGAIAHPFVNPVPVKRNETLQTALSIFNFLPSADSSRIIIQDAKTKETKTVSMKQSGSIMIFDGDIVTISEKKNYPETKMATILGAVSRPGTYPIQQNETVKDLILMADGFRPQADSSRAFLIKNVNYSEYQRDTAQSLSFFSTSFSIRPPVNIAMNKLLHSGDFSILPFGEKGKMEKEYILSAGDKIFIPETERYVYISGKVENPGAYLYNPEKKVSYFIKQAGGYAKYHDRKHMYILRKYGEKIQIRGSLECHAGDIIVVPEREQFRVWNIIKDVVALISALTTTILVIRQI